MSKIKVVITSKDDSFKFTSNDAEKFRGIADFEFIKSNIKPLPEVFNFQLAEARKSKDLDFLIFIHADVKLDFNHFISHLEEVKEKYDVIGLCGTSKLSISQSPLNWFCGSRPFPEARWGCVTHGEVGGKTSYYSQHSPNIEDHPVSCIDGLCIVFGKNALNDANLKFDESFKWDFYDTDLSFQCVMREKLRLGVIVEKSLEHYSIGKSILTKDFLIHEVDFRKKWGLPIPDNSPIKMLNLA